MVSELTKYPRTPHLPGSPGSTSDDKYISREGLALLTSGIDLVVTEKLDGGNYTMARDHAFARSLDGTSQPWDNPVKALWASVRRDIPSGWRVSGESLYARRSVAYTDLPGWFVVFGIWNDLGELVDWEATETWAALLDLPVAPVLYRGDDFTAASAAWSAQRDTRTSEGFVMRDAGSFHQRDFAMHVAKWVRAGHVQTSDSWRQRDDFEINTMGRP